MKDSFFLSKRLSITFEPEKAIIAFAPGDTPRASLEEALVSAETPQVKAARVIYPNVNIRIKEMVYLNQNELTNTLFCEQEGEVQAMPYVR